LAWDEEVVSHRVRREMCQVSIADGAQPGAVGGGKNLFPDVPVMAVPPLGYILLGEGDVCCDGAVEKMKWMGLDDRTDGGRKQVERSQHTLTQSDMRPWTPRPKGLRL
jgi:hypothetical protein